MGGGGGGGLERGINLYLKLSRETCSLNYIQSMYLLHNLSLLSTVQATLYHAVQNHYLHFN
jgi:hypothetical protein